MEGDFENLEGDFENVEGDFENVEGGPTLVNIFTLVHKTGAQQ